ncbi:MAG: hypothetical protein QOH89_501 [Pseudonocardiales bacterium]|nr:hypothetical protein [Pseudonocardiales bacterium]
MVDDSEPGAESDLRRRAAWLLAMLAIVAVLLIVVISAVVSTNDGGGGDSNGGPGPLDSVATTASGNPSGQPSTRHRRHHPGNGTDGGNTGTSSVPVGGLTCPTAQTCILDGDVGNSIQAINDFRAGQGLPAVPGSVSPAAQTCAVTNGNGCSGGWAETLLSKPDGQEAVQKIQQFAHFDDPDMTSIEVGWAYDPGAKLYYFAIVRNH